MKTTRRELLTGLPLVGIPVQYNDSHLTAPAATPTELADRPDQGELLPPETETRPGLVLVRPATRPAPAGPPDGPGAPRPSGSGRGSMPRYLTRILRSVAGLDLAAGTWLLLVGAHRVPCATRLCTVATLNNRHEVAGLTAVIAALLLAGAALFTSGLTRAGTVTTIGLIGIALTGLLAVIGVVLAAAIVLSVIGLVLGAVVAVMVGAIRGDLTR